MFGSTVQIRQYLSLFSCSFDVPVSRDVFASLPPLLRFPSFLHLTGFELELLNPVVAKGRPGWI